MDEKEEEEEGACKREKTTNTKLQLALEELKD